MSKKSFANAIHHTNRDSGGSTLTKVARSAHLKKTVEDLTKVLNIQIKGFDTLKTKQVQALVDHWRVEGTSPRSIQNRLSSIRSALRQAGRGEFAGSAQLSNKALGVSGASRDGTHRPPDQARLEERLNALPRRARVLVDLQLALGLRAREAVQAASSLATWAKQAQKGYPIGVVHGTKGGKPREVTIAPHRRDGVIRAIAQARAHLKATGQPELIASRSLAGAIRAFQRDIQAAGFVGAEASHSFRYGFSQEQIQHHLERAADRREALARLSLDLGHGDGRGRYVDQVYLKVKGASS